MTTTRTTPGAWLGSSLARVIVALAAAVIVTAVGASASAQGRCNCNSGCHAYPGQCVLRGGEGCDTGYAPFCGTRATRCPQDSSWVSCSGTCQCVRIPGFDAGVVDAGAPDVRPADTGTPPPPDSGVTPPRDVVSMDTPSTTSDVPGDRGTPLPTDAPRTDAPVPTQDVPASMMDVRTPTPDAPFTPSDTPFTPTDRPVTPSDTPFTPTDAPVTPGDASFTPSDASVPDDRPGSIPEEDAGPCECPGGVCVGGRCITDRCQYSPELGFLCSTAGTSCRVIDGEPFCVPLCLGVRCASNEFCDRSSGGECVADNCAMIRCPSGLTCYRNQCGRFGDGGFVAEDDAGGGTTAPDASTPSDGSRDPAVNDGGCGCRTRSTPAGGAAYGALLVLFGALVRARRRARTTRR